MSADDWTEEKAGRLFVIIAFLLLYVLAVYVLTTDRAWRSFEESHERWVYPAAPRLGEGCGPVLDAIVCVNTDLVGR